MQVEIQWCPGTIEHSGDGPPCLHVAWLWRDDRGGWVRAQSSISRDELAAKAMVGRPWGIWDILREVMEDNLAATALMRAMPLGLVVVPEQLLMH